MNSRHLFLIALVLIALVGISTATVDYNAYMRYKSDIEPAQPLPTPTPEPVVQAVLGVDVSMYHYRVMVLDGIDQDQIITSLRYVPNLFSFEIVAEDTTQYEWKGVYPVPITTRLITMFNGTAHGYTHPQAMGYYYGSGRATVVYLGQDPYPFSWIITHECLHEALACGTIKQDDLPSFSKQWNDWMVERGVGFWSGGEDRWIGTGWNRLQQDFLISQAMAS